MGAADIATPSNHPLDQGRFVESPNIRVPSLPNLEMVMQENQKLKAMLESLMQQLETAAPLPPLQPPQQAQQKLQPQQLQQASQPALPTVTPQPGNPWGKLGAREIPLPSNSKKEERRSASTLNERLNTPYSFTREHTRELLDICLQENLMTLPEPKRPEEAAMVDKPNYCLYHRVLGHALENCYLFKNWAEKLIQAGIIDMAEHLVNPPKPHQQPKHTFFANVINVMTQARSQ
ncbi:hypothetical protein Taro_004204 [Colocasia esculenta]|uniref:Uncharacterized protein n=1 Tax=Colocasia esculenta TaxID=4460 RepID=A0A843TR07_COLES|nr:hypothetical protein [Colocasia esculenta]